MKKNSIYFLIGFSPMILFACNANEETETKTEIVALPYYNAAEFTPHWLADFEDSIAHFHKIPPFSLINQKGETITEKTVDGKIYVVDFFFTSCPGICPKMTANMKDLQDEFLNDDAILLLSHSVTPEIDTIEKLQRYAVEKGVDAKRWHLLTGERQAIYNLGRKAYFVEESMGLQKSEDDFLHTENFVLIDKNRHIRGIYNGLNKADVQQLIEDIKVLKKE
jgi:protein SCO1/2